MTLKTHSLARSHGIPVRVLVFLAMVFVAIIFGLLAVTANPMFIGLGVGLVGGVILLAIPRMSIYLLLAIGLSMGAMISFAGPAFGKLPWAMSLLGILLLIPAFLHIVGRNKHPTPLFVWLVIAFMLYALIATGLQFESIGQFFAGFKRYFQVTGMLLALALLAFDEKDFRRWQNLLLGIGVLQIPFSLYALLVLVPQRGGLETASYTTDVVAGTFGANLEGGSPGIVMVVFLLVVFSFLFSRWRSGLISKAKTLLLSVILLLPLGMAENKIAIFMVPMVWFVLVRHDLARSPVKYLPVLLSGLLFTGVLGYVYVVLIMKSNLADVVEATINYNFAEAGYGSFYLNRTTVLSFWFGEQGMHNPISFFFGNGLGSAFLGQISGHIGMRYPYYGIDLTAASTLLWDLGIIGFMMFAAIFVVAWCTAGKIYSESQDGEVKADCLAIQAAISLFLLLIFYSQDIVNLISMEIVYSAVLGYLGYLYSRHYAAVKVTGA